MSKAFKVEMEVMPCQCCKRGGYWIVVGPNGVATGTSYSVKEDAEDLAMEMNYAYALGLKQGKKLEKAKTR